MALYVADSTNTGNDAGHIILLANQTNVAVTTNEDGALSIANIIFMIQGSTYSTTTNSEGTIRIYFSQEGFNAHYSCFHIRT